MKSRSLSAALALSFASAFLLIAGGRAAETHVDCDKVLRELVNGKSAQEVANHLAIPASAVYDCENAKAATVREGIPSAAPTASVAPAPASPR